MKKKRKKKKGSEKIKKPSKLKKNHAKLKKKKVEKKLDVRKKLDSVVNVPLSILNKQKVSENASMRTMSSENFSVFQEVKGTLKRIIKIIEEQAKQEKIEQYKREKEQRQAEKLEEKKKKDHEKELKRKWREEKEFTDRNAGGTDTVLTQRYETNLSVNMKEGNRAEDVNFTYDYMRKKMKKSRHHCKKHSDGSHCKRKRKKKEHDFMKTDSGFPIQKEKLETSEVVFPNGMEIGETVEISTEYAGDNVGTLSSPFKQNNSVSFKEEKKEENIFASKPKKGEFEFMDEYLKFMARENETSPAPSPPPRVLTKVEKPARPTTIVLPQQRKPRKEVRQQGALMKSAQKLLKSLPKHSRRPPDTTVDNSTNRIWASSTLQRSTASSGSSSSAAGSPNQTKTSNSVPKGHPCFTIESKPKETTPPFKRLFESKSVTTSFTQNTFSNVGNGNAYKTADGQQQQQQQQQLSSAIPTTTTVNKNYIQFNPKIIRPPVLQVSSTNLSRTTNQNNWIMLNRKTEASQQTKGVNYLTLNSSRDKIIALPKSFVGNFGGGANGGLTVDGSKSIYIKRNGGPLPSTSLLISNPKKLATVPAVVMKCDNNNSLLSVTNSNSAQLSKSFVQKVPGQSSSYLIFPQHTTTQSNGTTIGTSTTTTTGSIISGGGNGGSDGGASVGDGGIGGNNKGNALNFKITGQNEKYVSVIKNNTNKSQRFQFANGSENSNIY